LKKLEQYVEEITSDLPDDEKKELREEIFGHLHDHLNELIIKGYSEEEAVRQAIESFGNQFQLNRELKRAVFPFYKPIRFAWSVIFVTGFLCSLSYFTMEYYQPKFDNSLPLFSVLMGMLLVTVTAGVGEVMYEGFASQHKKKWWLNPWVFFLVPALLLGAILTPLLFHPPEQYPYGWWLDVYVFPIGAFVYVVSRQLFTFLFVRNKNNLKRTSV
jgi:hypothetical protein